MSVKLQKLQKPQKQGVSISQNSSYSSISQRSLAFGGSGGGIGSRNVALKDFLWSQML